MNPVNFLLLHDNPQAGQWLAGLLKQNVTIEVVPWSEGWPNLTRAAIYKKGPDLAVLGGTAAGDFVGMAALRPFAESEVALLGGAQAFLPVVWRMAYQDNPRQVWSIPWFCGTYAIYYWRDLLEKAGLDERTAFDTPDHLENTLHQLQTHGQSTPWSVPTHYSLANLHCVASWIWGLGGDMISRDGKRLMFDSPEVLEALRRYFHTFRYLHPASRNGQQDMKVLLAKREVAAAMGSSAWLGEMRRQGTIDFTRPTNLGIALPPGPAFVGANSLAIFQYCQYPQDAFRVVQALVDARVQKMMSEHSLFGQLPVLTDVLSQPPYTTDPHYKVLIEGLRTGRTYPVVPMWGMIETRLTELLSKIEAAVLAEPEADLESLINPMVRAVSDRLRMTLELE